MRLIPGVPYAAPPRAQAAAGALAWPPKLVVVHATDNPTSNATGEARYAATRTDPSGSWTSCHAYVDAVIVLGSLPLDYRAWSAYGWANANGIHIELCGVSGRVPEPVRRAGAALVRQLCLMAGIPMRHLDGPAVRRLHDSGGIGGVCGHGDITAASFDDNDHTDPGFTAADWARFMGWVSEGDDDMGLMDDASGQALAWQSDAVTFGKPTIAGGPQAGLPVWLVGAVERLEAAAAADAVRDAAAKVAIDALATALAGAGGSVDSAAVIARINAVAAAESATVTALHAEVASLRAALAAAAHAAGDAIA